MEEQENEEQERKLEDCAFESVGWLFRHLNTRFPRVLIARLHLSLMENVFRQDMVVPLNPACVLLSGMLYVYKSDVSVAAFET